jgi:transcriptional regulator GlxA family with amidase domain
MISDGDLNGTSFTSHIISPDWRIAYLLDKASCTDCLTLEHAAKLLRLSPRRVSVLFRRHTGISFKCFVRNRRMDIARALLRDPALSIKEIAFATGYSATSNFDRDFRHTFGLRPRDFRHALMGSDACTGYIALPDLSQSTSTTAPRGD